MTAQEDDAVASSTPLETINLRPNDDYPHSSQFPLILRYPARPKGPIRLAPSGERNWLTKRVRDADEAETFLIEHGDRGIIASIRVEVFIAWYLKTRRARSKACGADFSSAAKWLLPVAGKLTMAQLDKKVMETVYNAMVEGDLKTTTIRNKLYLFRGMTNKAVSLGLMDHDPVSDLLPLAPAERNEDSVPSPVDTDIVDLRAEATAREGVVLELAFGGAARGRQIMAVRWTAANWAERRFTLPGMSFADDQLDHSREVKLTDHMMLALIRLRLQQWRVEEARDDEVFPNMEASYTPGRMMQALQIRCGRSDPIGKNLRLDGRPVMDFKTLGRAPGAVAALEDGRLTAISAASGYKTRTAERYYRQRKPLDTIAKIGDFELPFEPDSKAGSP